MVKGGHPLGAEIDEARRARLEKELRQLRAGSRSLHCAGAHMPRAMCCLPRDYVDNLVAIERGPRRLALLAGAWRASQRLVGDFGRRLPPAKCARQGGHS